MGQPQDPPGSVCPPGPVEESLVQAIPDLIFINRQDGTYLSCHASDPTQLYVKPEDFLQRRIQEVLPPALAARFTQAFQAAGGSAGVQTFTYELEVEGRTQVFEARVARCTPDAFLSIVRNITERQAFEDGIRRNAMTLKAILASTADGILAIDQHRKVLHFNERFAALWNLPPAMLQSGDDGLLLSHVLSQLVDPEGFLAKVEALYRSDQADMDVLAFKDGRTVERYSIPMVLDGAISGRVWSFRDVTARVQADAARASVERQRHLLHRAESLGRMAGSVAHHFNNKLQSILGTLDLLARLDATGAAEAHLATARAATQQAAEISRQLATYLGQPLDRTSAGDLNTITQTFVDSLRTRVSPKVTLEGAFAPGPLRVEIHEDRFHQALGNLASNALDALGGGVGTLHFETRVVAAEDIPSQHRRPLDWSPGQARYACLSLSDSGMGMPPAVLECAWDPFFSTQGLGRGLGLPVTLGIAQAHRGCLTLESTEDQGTRASLYLPLLGPPTGSPADRTFPPPEASARPRTTVLLIDDDELILLATGAMLEELGYTVIAASGGQRALELFPKLRPELACVICDLTMPGLDGWQTLQGLREIDPTIPILLSTGYDRARVMAQDPGNPPEGFLWKPYDLITLKAELLRVVGAVPPGTTSP